MHVIQGHISSRFCNNSELWTNDEIKFVTTPGIVTYFDKWKYIVFFSKHLLGVSRTKVFVVFAGNDHLTDFEMECISEPLSSCQCTFDRIQKEQYLAMVDSISLSTKVPVDDINNLLTQSLPNATVVILPAIEDVDQPLVTTVQKHNSQNEEIKAIEIAPKQCKLER